MKHITQAGGGGSAAGRAPAAARAAGGLDHRLGSADAEVRRLAVIDLPYGDEDDIVPLLLPRLADPDASFRSVGARCGYGLPPMR